MAREVGTVYASEVNLSALIASGFSGSVSGIEEWR